jgi:hypothetical protein
MLNKRCQGWRAQLDSLSVQVLEPCNLYPWIYDA